MINIDLTDITGVIAFWLCFTRWTGILMQLPLFDDVRIPVIIKVLGSLVITYAFFPFLKDPIYKDIAVLGADNFWLLTIYHLIIGLVIGLVVRVIMNIFIAAGSIISQQIGFIAMRYFDPTSVQSVGPFEIFIKWCLVIMILTSGALFPMFKGAYTSFFTLNLTYFKLANLSPAFFFDMVKSLFLSGLLLASPIIFSNLIIMAIMGIIARMVPQMNVLMISFTVNIGVGLFVITMIATEFFHAAFKLYTEGLAKWFEMIV